MATTVTSPLLAWTGLQFATFKEDYTGYQGLALALQIMLFALVLAILTGLLSAVRKEKPGWLAMASIIISTGALILLVIKSPG